MAHNYCQKIMAAKMAVMSTDTVMVTDAFEVDAMKDRADALTMNEMNATSVVSGSTADTVDGKKVDTVDVDTVVIEDIMDIMDMADLHPKNSMLMVSQSRAQ